MRLSLLLYIFLTLLGSQDVWAETLLTLPVPVPGTQEYADLQQINPDINAAGITEKLESPNHVVRVNLFARDRLSFDFYSHGQTPFDEESPLGLILDEEDFFSGHVKLLFTERRSIDETWNPIAGKFKEVHNRANEVTLHLQETREKSPRLLDLVVRAYDDGMAFRYVLPKQEEFSEAILTGELTGFNFRGDYECWHSDYQSFNTSQEANFRHGHLSNVESNTLVGMPLLVKTRKGLWLAFTEADVTNWAGSRLYRRGYSDMIVEWGLPTDWVLKLAVKDQKQTPVKVTLPAQSPWRVIMAAKNPGDLIESNLIENLNLPSQIEDTSWIKPGIASWDWWSGRSRMETAEIKKFIQLSADMGWPYMLLDAGWNYHNDQPDGDIMRVVDSIDMPELLRFAKERNVRLWLWMSWRDVLRNDAYKKAFPMFREWGIAGVKIDYMDREDQEMVDFYHTMFKATADNHLMLDLHGAYKPTGARRTWPNFITQEGVLGNEQNRGSRNDTARHNVTIPYTRGLLGPMDYTPGGFVNQTPAQFQPVEQMRPPGHGTTVPNTRGQELAKFVVFESPLQMACDYPDNYRDQPGADFLKIVKASWDEVKFLGGEVGESIVLARRSGDDWFVGGMTNEDARKTDVKLDFLTKGKSYRATIWRDAPDADKDATKLIREEKDVTAADALSLQMAPAGGFVIHLAPAK